MIDIKFILHDASSRVILALPKSEHIGQFLQHNILDTRLTTTSAKKWDNIIATAENLKRGEDQIVYEGGFSWLNNSLVFSKTLLTPLYKIKRIRAKFLAKGFEFVNDVADSQTTFIASTGYFLTLDDIRLFPNILDLVETLADAYGISNEAATQHLIVEKQSLLNVEKYRKNLIWRHCKTLLAVNNEDDYLIWKNNVKIISGGLGLI